jgi:hypothetical protein
LLPAGPPERVQLDGHQPGHLPILRCVHAGFGACHMSHGVWCILSVVLTCLCNLFPS